MQVPTWAEVGPGDKDKLSLSFCERLDTLRVMAGGTNLVCGGLLKEFLGVPNWGFQKRILGIPSILVRNG